MRRLCEINFRSVVDVGIGGFEPLVFDGFRVSSLRGVARWVLRALVGGVAYDFGYDEVEVAGRAQELIFGGSSVSSLIVYHLGGVLVDGFLDLGRSVNPQLQLLSRGREVKTEGAFARVVGGNIDVFSRVVSGGFEVAEELGVISTVLGLVLVGLGKRSRRGFGNFDIDIVCHSLAGDVCRGISMLSGLSGRRNLSDIVGALREVLDLGYQKAKELIESLNLMGISRNAGRRPKFPVFSKDHSKVFLVRIYLNKINCEKFVNISDYRIRPLDVLDALIQRYYYFKGGRKVYSARLGGLAALLQGVFDRNFDFRRRSDVPRRAARSLSSFWLGLPREGSVVITKDSMLAKRIIVDYKTKLDKAKGEIISGFKSNENLANRIFDVLSGGFMRIDRRGRLRASTGYISLFGDRRASPLIISTIREDVQYRRGLFLVSVFDSDDWPDYALWISGHMSGNSRKNKRHRKNLGNGLRYVFYVYLLDIRNKRAYELLKIIVNSDNKYRKRNKSVNRYGKESLVSIQLSTKKKSMDVRVFDNFIELADLYFDVLKSYCDKCEDCIEFRNVWP